MSIRVFNKPAVVIGGGSSATLSSISISSNGTYSASAFGVDGFDVVDVDVQGSAIATDKQFNDYLKGAILSFTFPSEFNISKYIVRRKLLFADDTHIKSIDMNKVASMPDFFFRSVTLTSVVASNTLTLGTGCFYQMSISGELEFPNIRVGRLPSNGYVGNEFVYVSFLSSVAFPKLAALFGNTFCSCSQLRHASLPELTMISGFLFNYISRMQEIDLPNLVFGNIAGSMSQVQYLNLPIFRGFANYVISSASLLSYVNIPYAAGFGFSSAPLLSEIDAKYAQGFSGCFSLPLLKSLFLPLLSAQATVGSTQKNPSLSVVTLGGVRTISTSAFSSCTSLESLYILNCSIVSLQNVNAFANTPFSNEALLGHYGSIYVPSSWVSSYKTATNWATYSDRITALPSEFDSKYAYAFEFYNRSDLTEIPLSKKNVEFVCAWAFYGCSNLQTIDLPSCLGICYSAFYSVRKISLFSAPLCNVIQDYALDSAAMSYLTDINIPKIKYLGTHAFRQASLIKKIDCPECFYMAEGTFISSMYSCSYIDCHNLRYKINPFIVSSSLTYADFTELRLTSGNAILIGATSLSGVFSTPHLVYRGGLQSASKITSVYAPNLVWDPFYNGCNNLESIHAPLIAGGSTYYTFYNCRKVPSFNFAPYSSMLISMFQYCQSIEKAYVPNTIEIYENVFAYCEKMSKILFENLTNVGSSAFNRCSALESVYFFAREKAKAPSYMPSMVFYSTPIQISTLLTPNRYGSIFVPMSLLSEYQNDSGWSYYSERFVGLTDEQMQDIIDHFDD